MNKKIEFVNNFLSLKSLFKLHFTQKKTEKAFSPGHRLRNEPQTFGSNAYSIPCLTVTLVLFFPKINGFFLSILTRVLKNISSGNATFCIHFHNASPTGLYNANSAVFLNW